MSLSFAVLLCVAVALCDARFHQHRKAGRCSFAQDVEAPLSVSPVGELRRPTGCVNAATTNEANTVSSPDAHLFCNCTRFWSLQTLNPPQGFQKGSSPLPLL